MKAEFETQIEGMIPRILITPETNAEKILLHMFRSSIFGWCKGLHFTQVGPPSDPQVWDPRNEQPRREHPLPDGTIVLTPVIAEDMVGGGHFKFHQSDVLRTSDALPKPPKEE